MTITNVRKYDSAMTVTHNSSTSHHYNVERHQLTNECLKILKLPQCKPLSNTCFLGPTRVHNPNGISIGSAVFAEITIVIDRQTDRQTDHAYRPCSSVGIRRETDTQTRRRPSPLSIHFASATTHAKCGDYTCLAKTKINRQSEARCISTSIVN